MRMLLCRQGMYLKTGFGSKRLILNCLPKDFPWKNFPWQEAIVHFTRLIGLCTYNTYKKANEELGILNDLKIIY
jgi:hypothetical protein